MTKRERKQDKYDKLRKNKEEGRDKSLQIFNKFKSYVTKEMRKK